ncbi:hypothetical protein D9756_005608 [Leucocoprinus leucothites]|uniref:Uncharacterized protein n=1 Tax=Leucocoprinus leucothites TaxID=201217 RepID=A0A8H5D852_9AGAR|nr:hypothetical protein D9756_005608 [Leucoagaricus leucothites]
MLRPIITEPTKLPPSKLEMTIARAEKLNSKFTSVNGVCAPPVHAYRLENRDGLRSPLVVMGEYLVCLTGNFLKRAYQWISKRSEFLENGRTAFEYEVPTRVDPHGGQKVTDDRLYQMDHDSNTFYVITGPHPASGNIHEHVQRQLAEIKLDDIHSKPYLSECSQLVVNPQKRPIYYMSMGNCLTVYHYKPDSGYEIDVTIADFRTKTVTHYQLVFPNPPDWGVYFKQHIYASDTHLLLMIHNTHFHIFARPSTHNTTSAQLQAISSGPLPLTQTIHQMFHQTNPDSFITVGVKRNRPSTESTLIHVISFKNTGPNWIAEAETKTIPGSHFSAGGAVFAVPPSPKINYTLGVLSCRFFPRPTGTSPGLGSTTYQLLRIEGFNMDIMDEPPSNHINLTRMDMESWVEDKRVLNTELCCIDFDPFSGTALLVSPASPDTAPGCQSIVVLDYLSKGDTTA